MKSLRGAKVLVIGGAGFIGSHVVEELIKEPVNEIIVYDNFCRGVRENLSEALNDSRVQMFDAGGDICQIDILNSAMQGVDYVFHLAALWLLQCHEYPRAAFDVNVAGTFNVLEACIKNNVKKLIYSSSASVYGDAEDDLMNEKHPFNNRTFYGATKIAGEQMCRAFFERYGLSYVALRYMNVYGARQDDKGAYVSVVAKLMDAIYKSKLLTVYGDGNQCYDFVYVTDVAKANILALKSDANDICINVGTGVGTSISELCELTATLVGSNIPINYDSTKQTFVTKRIGDTTAAKAKIDFTSEVGIVDGMRATMSWFGMKRHLEGK